MAVTIGWYYGRQREAMEAAAIQELSSIVEAKRTLIVHWRDERIGDGRVLTFTPAYQAARKFLSTGKAAAADRRDMDDVLAAMKREFGYSNAVLVDNSGDVKWRLENQAEVDSGVRRSERAKLVTDAHAMADVLLSDIREEDDSSKRLITLTVPVAGLGAFQLELLPSKVLYPYLASWPGPGRSGEVLLVRREGDDVVYLSDRRYRPRVGGLVRRSLKGTALPSDEEMDAGAPLRGHDYRGVLVLAEVRRIARSPWMLLAKMDSQEVNAPIARVGGELALLMGLIAIANAAGIGFLWKSRQLRLQLESERRFRAIADDTPALLWMVSPDFNDIFINRGLKDFVGRHENRLPREAAKDIHEDDFPSVIERFKQCWQQRIPYSDEFRLKRTGGVFRWVACQGAPRFSTSGEFLGYAGCLLDVTDLKDTEAKLTNANVVLEAALDEKTRREAEIRALSDRLINAQEEERRKVSRELHDDLSQRIAALSIAMGNLQRGLLEKDSEAKRHSDGIQKSLVVLSDVVRRISHELHPSVLQHSGLAAAIRQYCHEFKSLAGVKVEVTTVGDFKDVPDEIALNIYRITQEALRNVAKHAGVDTAKILLSRNFHHLRLLIVDEGRGISKDSSTHPSGLGLISMRERARLVGGALHIQSAVGEGTTIRVEEPIRSNTWRYSENSI